VPHLVLVFRGRVVDMREGEDHLIRAGEVVLHPAGIVHENQMLGPDVTLLAIDLPGPSSDVVAALYGGSSRNVSFSFESVQYVPERIREEAVCGDDAAGYIIPALVEQLLALGSRAVARQRNVPHWLLHAEGIVRRLYAERLTVSDIAERVGVSASTLTHKFRDVHGRSFSDFLRQRRVQAAARSLGESDDPISAIAGACGFADQAHLTRVFRQTKGCTPLEYRRRMHASLNER
jgi:AraC-like DNA-binding protein